MTLTLGTLARFTNSPCIARQKLLVCDAVVEWACMAANCARMYKQHHSDMVIVVGPPSFGACGWQLQGVYRESVAPIIAPISATMPTHGTPLPTLTINKGNSSSGIGDCCRCQHMKDRQQAVPHSLLLQARPAMTSHQIPIAARNKRSGASAVKAGCQFQGLIPPMVTVQKPVDGADITRWLPIWDSCLPRYSAG